MTNSSTRQLDRLARLDTCAVSDALDALELPGSVLSPVPLAGTRRICGKATTVLLRQGPDPENAEKVHLCARAIDASGADDIIVIEHPDIDAGGWGGVLSRAALFKGITGVVLNGPCRDIDEAREIGFSVFGTRGITRTARARLHEHATNEPITIDGVVVCTDDYVIADTSGVVFIPAGEIDNVLKKAEAIATRENKMVAAIESGTSVVDVLGADYEDMLNN